MITYTQASRYYSITEDPDIIQTDLIVMNTSYEETTVQENERNSPELVAQRVYNQPNYWWVICQYNGIMDPRILPAGMKIKYPLITHAPRSKA